MKIFYDKKTLEIKGMSDGEDSMLHPYVETEVDYHSTENMKIEMVDNKPKLILTKVYL